MRQKRIADEREYPLRQDGELLLRMNGRHRSAAIRGERIPELPMVVQSPALDHGASGRRAGDVVGALVLTQRARVVSPRADLLIDAQSGDSLRDRLRRGGSRIPELA